MPTSATMPFDQQGVIQPTEDDPRIATAYCTASGNVSGAAPVPWHCSKHAWRRLRCVGAAPSACTRPSHSPCALPRFTLQVVCVSRGFGNVLGWAAEDVIGKAR